MLSSHRQSGLEFATAADGTSEWVRPEDVERFKVEGEALLGKKTNPSDAEKGAHKTALSQLEVMRLKQVNSESQTEQLQVVRPGEASTAQLLEKMNEMHVELKGITETTLEIKNNQQTSCCPSPAECIIF